MFRSDDLYLLFFSIPERSFQFLKVLKEDTLLLNEKGLRSSLS